MRKDSIMTGVLGLIIGLVIGFLFANNVNRSSPTNAISTSELTESTISQNGLPPDHPPLGTSSGESTGAPLPQVTEAIERARRNPNDYEAQMTAADLYYQIQRFDEAASLYEAAVKLRPAEAEPLIKAGNAHFDSEQYVEAEKWYLRALEKEPRNVNVRTDLGLTFFLRQPSDVQRAIKEYNASLAIDPQHEVTLQNLTVAYREAGDTDNLRATVERLRKVNPNNRAITSGPGS